MSGKDVAAIRSQSESVIRLKQWHPTAQNARSTASVLVYCHIQTHTLLYVPVCSRDLSRSFSRFSASRSAMMLRYWFSTKPSAALVAEYFSFHSSTADSASGRISSRSCCRAVSVSAPCALSRDGDLVSCGGSGPGVLLPDFGDVLQLAEPSGGESRRRSMGGGAGAGSRPPRSAELRDPAAASSSHTQKPHPGRCEQAWYHRPLNFPNALHVRFARRSCCCQHSLAFQSRQRDWAR